MNLLKKGGVSALLLSIFFSFASYAKEKVNIFTCEPEWQSLASEIGGDHIISFSATNADQDPHYIRAKPSLIAKIRSADLLICSGADLEIGWLPLLLEKGKKQIQIGKIGNLMASDFVKTIEKVKIVDRSQGDVHPYGNPHIHLDPHNILIIAKEIKNRLLKIDPQNTKNYQNNYNNFTKKWKRSIRTWKDEVKKLRNIKVITSHKAFSYIFNWIKISEVTTLEPKPGIAPTAKHLRKILEMVKNNNDIKFIIRAKHHNHKASEWLSRRSKIKELILPFTIDKNSPDLFALFDNIISKLQSGKIAKQS